MTFDQEGCLSENLSPVEPNCQSFWVKLAPSKSLNANMDAGKLMLYLVTVLNNLSNPWYSPLQSLFFKIYQIHTRPQLHSVAHLFYISYPRLNQNFQPIICIQCATSISLTFCHESYFVPVMIMPVRNVVFSCLGLSPLSTSSRHSSISYMIWLQKTLEQQFPYQPLWWSYHLRFSVNNSVNIRSTTW